MAFFFSNERGRDVDEVSMKISEVVVGVVGEEEGGGGEEKHFDRILRTARDRIGEALVELKYNCQARST